MRIALVVLCLVLSPLTVLAQPASRSGTANALIFWEHPVAWHAKTTYEARVTSVVNGRSTQTVQPLRRLPSSECQVLAAVHGEDWTDESLCAEVCQALGESTTTVWARTETAVAGPSNDAYARLNRTCGPQPRAPVTVSAKPGTSTIPAWAIGAGAVGTAVVASAGSSPTLPALVNPACVSWKVIAPPTPVTPCLTIEYWEPTYLVEIVKHPGTTAIPILGDLLKTALAALGISLFGGGGAGNASGAGHTNLQYAEAHVWSFPQLFGGPCTGCAPINALPILHYASEADAVSWRTTIAPPGIPGPALLPVGVWGNLFPRVGFAQHASPTVAAALQGFRALNIAFLPVTGPPVPEAHVIVSPPAGLSYCLQLASPAMTPCFPAGTPPPVWEHGTTSLNGSYIWIAWTKRTCCVPPPGTCGITVPPLGLAGMNLCPL